MAAPQLAISHTDVAFCQSVSIVTPKGAALTIQTCGCVRSDTRQRSAAADVSEKFEGVATVCRTYSTAESARLVDPKTPFTQPPQESAITDD